MRWVTGAAVVVPLLLLACAVRADGRIDAIVAWVDDGDTIGVRIDARVERVRYIGIDAPEVPHEGEGGTTGGGPAAELNRALVANRQITLELDVEARDRYGRLLAYVWVDGRMANLEMVRRGYARALRISPNLRYSRTFADAEREARRHRRGLWADAATRAPSVAGPKR